MKDKIARMEIIIRSEKGKNEMFEEKLKNLKEIFVAFIKKVDVASEIFNYSTNDLLMYVPIF